MEHNNLKRTARIAGILYLILFPLGFFGILYVPSTLVVSGDIAATANNIMANEMLFRLGITSALLTQLVQILLVLFLYKLLKSVNKQHAKLMVIFVLVGVPIAMLNELNNFAPLVLLSGGEFLEVYTTGQLHALLSLFLELHEYGIIIAQIFWGLWLFPLGYLVYRSGFIPKVLGILLIIGSIGYVVDYFTLIMFPNFGVTISEYTFLGELLFPLWLVIKAVKTPVERVENE